MAQAIKKDLVVSNGNAVTDGTLESLILKKETKDLIENALGKSRMQSFIGSALSVAQDPKMKDVEPTSLFNCLLKSATYNLPTEQSLGFCYYIPYKNKDGVKIAQFQLGVKAIVELAYRTNKYRRLNVKDVREGEISGYDFFGEVQIKWLMEGREKRPIIGYMAAFELTNGMTKRVYWNLQKIQEHANKYSKAHQNALKNRDTSDDLWTQNFGVMAEKTVLKDLLKYAPKSVELQDALRFDQAEIRRENGVETAVYVDNEDEHTEFDAEKVYDIDESTGEILEKGEEKKEEPKAKKEPETIVEDSDPNVKIILYRDYLDNKDIYTKEDYPDGSPAYKVQPDGKKTIRVRIATTNA